MKIFGPFDLEMVVYLTNGEQIAKADYRLSRGVVPTLENLRAEAVKVEEQIKEQLGADWRLCTKREYFDAITAEAVGPGAPSFAMPGSETEWDDA